MIIMKTNIALLVLVGTFCILIDLCNSDTTEENESKTEEVEEEPLLSTLDMIVLGLAGKEILFLHYQLVKMNEQGSELELVVEL